MKAIPWQLRSSGQVPDREAMITLWPAEERYGARRRDILPVPPVRRIVFLFDMTVL